MNIASAAVVETIDAKTVEGDITRLDEKGATVRTSDGEKTLPAGDLSKITFLEPSRIPDLLKTPGRAVVLTRAGDVLPTRTNMLRMENNRLKVHPGEIGLPMELPLKMIEAILLPSVDQSCEDVRQRCNEMQYTPGTKDILLIVGKDDRLQKVSGTLVGIADGRIRFAYGGKDRAVKADRVRAILPAKPTETFPPVWGWCKTTDGCAYAFAEISFSENHFVLQKRNERKIELPVKNVARITFQSDRLTPLADLKPASVREYGMFDRAIPHRANRSAAGGPLQLAGRRYETGLGLHGFCELTYDLGGKYRAFIATVGIDDAVRPNGSATLTILADGKPLLPETILTGRDAPRLIRLDVRGVKTLTIRVDFGPDRLDTADHVDLAGARLVK